MNVTTSMHTPAGNKVDPYISVADALRKAAALFRERTDIKYGRTGTASDALYSVLCATSAGAAVRCRAYEAIRTVALGSPAPGNLTGVIEGMTRSQLAELCERAAELKP